VLGWSAASGGKTWALANDPNVQETINPATAAALRMCMNHLDAGKLGKLAKDERSDCA
jgi:hypothetical protein